MHARFASCSHMRLRLNKSRAWLIYCQRHKNKTGVQQLSFQLYGQVLRRKDHLSFGQISHLSTNVPGWCKSMISLTKYEICDTRWWVSRMRQTESHPHKGLIGRKRYSVPDLQVALCRSEWRTWCGTPLLQWDRCSHPWVPSQNMFDCPCSLWHPAGSTSSILHFLSSFVS